MTTQSNQGAGAGAGSGVTEMIGPGERVRRWAGFYVSTLGWAVSPRWLTVRSGGSGGSGGSEICACPEGEACPYPGKHLVDGHRVVRPSQAVGEGGGAEADAAAVAAVWPQEHPDVARGAWGVAALCGSESGLLVWDLGRDGQMPADWLGGRGSLVARTPTGGRQWFFRLEPGEAVASVGGVPGVGGKILAEGSYVALHPYGGYTWSGMDALRAEGGLAEVPVGLRLVLEMAGVLVQGLEGVHEDDPWRCLPGAGLVGPVTRSYKRVGDVRRFVDGWGHLVRWTPGGGWSLWTSGKGWVSGEAAEAGIEAVLADGLVAAVRREAVDHRAGGRDAEAAEATRWAGGMGRRSVGYVKGELRSDPRVVLDGPEAWDADPGICGLPMVDGVGRVVDLGTGEVLPGARERLVSRKLGAGVGGAAWERARAVRKYLDDLGEVMGEDWLRLLQRVSGMTMFGAGGVEAARRAAGVGALAGGTDVVVELNGPPRSGKGGRVQDPLLLADGSWTTYGDVAVGDRVLGPDGRGVLVKGVHRRGVLPVWEVGFSDGASVVVDGDHIWNVRVRGGSRKFGTLVTTRELAVAELRADRGRSWQYSIPMCGPVEFEGGGGALPVDPWLLGALLGDGGLSNSSVTFTKEDERTVEEVRRSLPADCAMRSIGDGDGRHGWRIARVQEGRGGPGNSLLTALEGLGLRGKRSWEKEIPEQYLLAGAADRLALLQGLMDTDGESRGSAYFCTTSPALADGVRRLVQSLGGTVRTVWRQTRFTGPDGRKKDGRPSARITVRMPEGVPPFRVREWSPGKGRAVGRRSVVSVRPAGEAEVVCITVDREDGLYLTGADLVVTHNSTYVETLAAVMGDYARPMNQNLLFGRSGNPEFVVAAVRGARMIHLGEPPVGAELNVPLLKAISGGDSVTGRGVYGRAEVSYRPDCTVWLSTNHHLEHADEALWQRMRIFEFRTDWSARGGKGQSWIREAMIGEAVEREAFLAWVLAGARALVQEEDGWGGSWQVWDDAADEARAGVDPVAQFMAEVLVVGAAAAGSELSAARLKSAWQAWSMGHEIALDRALTLQHVMQELHQRAGRAGADWVKSARAYRNMAIREP